MYRKLALLVALAFVLPACGGGGGGSDVTPPPPPTPPTAPSGLTPTSAPGQIDLAWIDTSTDETGFDAERAPDAAGSPGTWVALPGSPFAADSTSTSDGGLLSSQVYWYRVRSFNAAGSSAWVEAGPASALPPSGELIAAFGTNGVVSTDDGNRISDMAADGTFVYTVGYTGVGDTSWHIEKRSMASGALDTSFDGDGIVEVNVGPVDSAEYSRAIVVNGTSMYVGGIGGADWRIEKRSLATGALDTGFDGDGIVTVGSTVPGAFSVNGVRAMATDGTWLYVGGTSSAAYWTLEKRSLATGTLDAAFGTAGRISYYTGSQLHSLVIDGTSMYVGGLGGGWRIEKRSLATGALDTTFDGDGVVLELLTFPAGPDAMEIDGTHLYVAGDNNGGWRIEKRSLATGALDTAFDGDGFVEFDPSGNGGDAPGDMVLEDGDLYVVGIDYAPGNGQWRIEKRNSATGALDTAFDGDGIVSVNPSTGTDTGSAIVLDATSIIVGGYQSGADSGTRLEKRTR